MRTYWSKGSALIAGEQAAFPVFVAAMAYSDATFLCRADDMGTKSWMTCCQRAFRSLGGVPYVTDCAQCKVSVTARSTIEAFARHYRTVLYGARPKTAKGAEGAGKPLDARTVSHVARKVIADVAGMDFASLEDLDAYVEGKLEAYNAMGSEDGPARWTLFKERELPQMLELPAEDADFATWSTRLVRDDYHFVVDGVRYSVPWRYSNEEVRVSWTDGEVRSYLNGELVARHERMTEMRGRCTVTDPAHRPPGHRWFAKRMDDRFLALASEEGPNVVRVMKRVLSACKKEGKGFRTCKELIDLRKTPSAAGVTLDEACRAVLDGGGEIGVAEVMEKLAGDAE
ncbi:Mu transposase domain-containing protein [Senegalimassilia anaerobia]|uniref:Mu transposase domain-containing protein n=2 Tax=Coriobacteriia TaxID=84998 RepID=UPI003A93B2A8